MSKYLDAINKWIIGESNRKFFILPDKLPQRGSLYIIKSECRMVRVAAVMVRDDSHVMVAVRSGNGPLEVHELDALERFF